MKSKKIRILVFLFAILTIACSENDLPETDSTQIKFGTVCGWCAGEEFILVSSTKVFYQKTIPCGDNAGTTKKSIDFNTSEWDLLIESFDYALFNTLNYNECNVCADGCDEFLQITENTNMHELRYAPSTEVEEIKFLREHLQDLLENMRVMD